MVTSIYNSASQIVGTRFRALDAWRAQIEKGAERRRVQADKVNLEKGNAVTNPHRLPPSSPILTPVHKIESPAYLIPHPSRDLFFTRVALAANTRADIFFNR